MSAPIKPGSNVTENSVQLKLYADGMTYCPTHVSSSEIVLENPVEINSESGTVEVIINGRAYQFMVDILPHKLGACRLAIRPRGDLSPVSAMLSA